MDAGLADHAEDLRQAQPALHPAAVRHHRPPGWGDPVNHPWTTGRRALLQHRGACCGARSSSSTSTSSPTARSRSPRWSMNNDFGKVYDRRFKALPGAVARTRTTSSYITEKIEPSAPDGHRPDDDARPPSKPDVFIAMLAGTPCTQVVTEAAQNGMKEDDQVQVPVVGVQGHHALTAGRGRRRLRRLVGGRRRSQDMASPAFDNDPWVAVRPRLRSTAAGYDYKSWADHQPGDRSSGGCAQAMLIAGQLNGGLTRSNLHLAMRSMDMTNPQLLPGIQLQHERQPRRLPGRGLRRVAVGISRPGLGAGRSRSSTSPARRSPVPGTRPPPVAPPDLPPAPLLRDAV